MASKHIIKLGVLGAVLTPVFVSAQGFFNTLTTITSSFGNIVNLLLPIVFALAVLAFFYGIFLYVFSQSLETKKEGKGIMLWSVVAIFIMASLFGIIQLAQGTLGITPGGGAFDTPNVTP